MEWANYNLELKTGWKFHLGQMKSAQNMEIWQYHATSKTGGALQHLDFYGEEKGWDEVTLPHDWMTGLSITKEGDPGNGYKERSVGWYYLKFSLSKAPIQDAELIFDGVLGQSTVYVNGVVAVRNFSGYNRFSCQVGDYLLPGEENEIAVFVDARRWEGWWYEGAGIYRPVTLCFRQATHFEPSKCFVRGEENRKVVATLGIAEPQQAEVVVSLRHPDGRVISKQRVEAKEQTEFQILTENPKLWSPEEPNLYCLECELVQEKQVVDTFTASVGFRQIEWIAERGMLLNGIHTPIKGICCHQDHAGVGAAVTKGLMEYRIDCLKKMEVNAYRCAHHAPSEELLEICDRKGMLVMAENRHFSASEEVLGQLDSLVTVCRNHPCIFLYSLFNEEPWQKEERGRRIAEKMRKRILNLDTTRAVTGAQNGGILEQSNASDVLDVIGVNYFLKEYEEAHKRTPHKVMIGTENCPTYATRGVYQSDPEKQIFSCYGEEWPDYFSESLTETMETIFETPYVAGCFVWSGFDYRGEPTPYGYPSVLSHWGFSDACGFPKDTAYLLGGWYRKELFAHLLPHWNWKEGMKVRVCAFTNGEEAELFLNGRSLGKKAVVQKQAEWEVLFEEGALSVTVTRGAESATDLVQTAGTSRKILLEDVTPDSEIHVVNVRITDERGVLVPDCSELIACVVKNGRVLGVGNGDPNSHHRDTDTQIPLFHGRAQVIVTGEELSVCAQGYPCTTMKFKQEESA